MNLDWEQFLHEPPPAPHKAQSGPNPILLLMNRACGHAIGLSNVMGRDLLEAQRVRLAFQGYKGWEIVFESDEERQANAICLPWDPCGTCGRHDIAGQPYLIGGAP